MTHACMRVQELRYGGCPHTITLPALDPTLEQLGAEVEAVTGEGCVR